MKPRRRSSIVLLTLAWPGNPKKRALPSLASWKKVALESLSPPWFCLPACLAAWPTGRPISLVCTSAPTKPASQVIPCPPCLSTWAGFLLLLLLPLVWYGSSQRGWLWFGPAVISFWWSFLEISLGEKEEKIGEILGRVSQHRAAYFVPATWFGGQCSKLLCTLRKSAFQVSLKCSNRQNGFLQCSDSLLRGHHGRGLRGPPRHRLLHRQLESCQSRQGKNRGKMSTNFEAFSSPRFPTWCWRKMSVGSLMADSL